MNLERAPGPSTESSRLQYFTCSLFYAILGRFKVELDLRVQSFLPNQPVVQESSAKTVAGHEKRIDEGAMKIINSILEMQRVADKLRRLGRSIGLVPTMGYLHEGHLSLARIARGESNVVVVSIFVNPTQFAPNEDLDAYPRDLERDESLCRDEGVDIVFYPKVEEMYQPGNSVCVTEDRLSLGLCGCSRPSHFQGVCTVVAKLFNIVQPDVAVFGKKDYQQLRVLEQMTKDLNFPVKIISGPIMREEDGLAMSSRNGYLSSEERAQAPDINQALQRAQDMYAEGERDAQKIQRAIVTLIEQIPMAKIDYVEIVDERTLEPLAGRILTRTLVAVAVYLGKTRLIDNVVLGDQIG